MHLHILGICGTFMAGLARLARELGHTVTGADANVYPPMSEQLRELGIVLHEGYDADQLNPAPDLVLVGNALSRGNPAVEALLDRGIPYQSGPAWLASAILPGRHVIAIAGTHGKTTTTSLVAWILEQTGQRPGFLVGGVPGNFGVSARLGEGSLFVIEADEYDTAFFDKRSKFVHYQPRTVLLNNLEFDHADIFADLAAIQRQFHPLVRTVPASGRIIRPTAAPTLDAVLLQGCWTPITIFGEDAADWTMLPAAADWSRLRITHGAHRCDIESTLFGRHNAWNTIAALATVHAATGLETEDCRAALASFRNARRRLEPVPCGPDIELYDDFAHHPTAIRETLAALRARVGGGRIVAIVEPRSNTMRLGIHAEELAGALTEADHTFLLQPPDLHWSIGDATRQLGDRRTVCDSVSALADAVAGAAHSGDHLLLMSNGGFGGLRDLLRQRFGVNG
ncbi:MAG: UDP-N-acetylmuramate:L-alanyl-gamma-D-glutamyl-meso-diaminopimelate ligase [Gammaproteobacteria bacterium]|nr:UDP-N-acetylmuramate:L-alanyl-gamma-D-glutamyl-meso-diaminopimelate ligase [Gammaproteobacteria bacterium]